MLTGSGGDRLDITLIGRALWLMLMPLPLMPLMLMPLPLMTLMLMPFPLMTLMLMTLPLMTLMLIILLLMPLVTIATIVIMVASAELITSIFHVVIPSLVLELSAKDSNLHPR
jgi:hypothetical protein